MTELTRAAISQRRERFSGRSDRFLKMDMTPLVDLGFLLITFFIYTTTLSDPAVLKLNIPPTIQPKDSTRLSEKLALTVLLNGPNAIYYYHGRWEQAIRNKSVFKTGFSPGTGIGEVIRKKQKELDADNKVSEGRNSLMLLIKPGQQANYQQVIDALDEALINNVKKYIILETLPGEMNYLKNNQGFISSK